jgi:cellobiose-specific phosphotransferase system component IIA
MCTALNQGGLRCAGHAKADIATAIKEFDANPSQEASDKIALAENAYYSTPEGIAKLREAGEEAKANRQQVLRDIRVKEASAVRVATEAEEAAEIAIKKERLKYARSPEGVAKLRAAGRNDLADRFEKEARRKSEAQPTTETPALTEEEQTLVTYVTEPMNSWRVQRLFNVPGEVHPAIQEEIIQKGDEQMMQSLASSEKCSPDNLARIVSGASKYPALAALNNRTATLDAVKAGISHANQAIRAHANQNALWQKHCEDKRTVLVSNAHLGDASERKDLLMQRTSMSVESLEALSKDESSGVRYGVAQHPDTPKRIIKELLEDPDEYVRGVAVRRDPETNVLAAY